MNIIFRLQHRIQAAGALLFACCMGLWYYLVVLLLATVDFPLTLPVGDLSTIVPGASRETHAGHNVEP